MQDNLNLFEKYNIPGPRYTSYPTAPFWLHTPSEREWIQSLDHALSQEQGTGAGLYVHIPFCRSLCTYCGCHKRITRRSDVSKPYIDALLTEWKLYQSRIGRKITLSEIHLGGGTPTFLSPTELQILMEGILSETSLSNEYEFSIEADPRVTSQEHLKMLYALGFKRLSLGVQDFDPIVQKAIHRIQTEDQVRDLTELAKEIGFQSINYDLIYGLPFQTTQSIRQTVDAILRLKPDRLAFYSYAHVPWIKPAQRRFTEADLPSGALKRELYEVGRSEFQAHGYREVGMDHFSLETDSLWKAVIEGTLHRNFMGYLHRRVSPLIGLGVSSIGDSWSAFSQNEKQIETYQKEVSRGVLPIMKGHILTEEDQILRRHILSLMTRFETHWNSPDTYTPFLANVHTILEPLRKDHLIQLTSHSCRVLPSGIPFLRNICMAFDAHLEKSNQNTQVFSKTI